MSHANRIRREADKVYTSELAKRALIHFFGRTWNEMEPVLADLWDQEAHAMCWAEARSHTKQHWLSGQVARSKTKGKVRGPE